MKHVLALELLLEGVMLYFCPHFIGPSKSYGLSLKGVKMKFCSNHNVIFHKRHRVGEKC